MIQQNLKRLGPSLVKNGSFAEGASHWFGSYLRHQKANYENDGFGDTNPTYQVSVAQGGTLDYLPGIPQGLSQFIDLPELYTFPSQRTAELLILRYAGDRLFTLAIQSGSTINGQPIVAGDPTASGPARFFQHPFRAKNEKVVTIAPGTIINADMSGQSLVLRAGSLVLDSDAVGEEIANHTLQASSDFEPAPLMSSQGNPEISVLVGGPNGSGAGVARFIGTGIEQILTVPRPDGTTGIRIGDTLVLPNATVNVISVATGPFTDPTTGVVSVNVGYRNLLATDDILTQTQSDEWAFYETMTVSASYQMPLYRYEFSLGYLYNNLEGDKPNNSSLQFRVIDDTTIEGIGDRTTELFPVPGRSLDLTLITGGPWKKQHDYFVTEVERPIAGRMLLNILPSKFETESQDFNVGAVSFNSGSPNIENGEVTFTLNLTVPDGVPFSAASFDGFNTVTFTVTENVNFAAGQVLYVAGGFNPFSTDAWLQSLIDTVTGMTVIETAQNGLSFTASISNINNNIGGSRTGLDSFPLRVTEEPPTDSKLQAGDSVTFQAPNLVGTWINPFIGQEREVLSQTLTNVIHPTDYDQLVTLRWGLTNEPDTSLAPDLSLAVLTKIVAPDSKVIISDITLHRGYTYSTLADTDDPNSDLSIDSQINHMDGEANLIPRGAVILYAGGGLCPAGFSAVRDFSTSLGKSGLTAVKELPWPDLVLPVEDGQFTELIYTGRTFDQLDSNGQPILLEGTARFVEQVLPGVFDSEGNPVVQTLEQQRAKQLIEPGMILRTDFRKDFRFPNTLVSPYAGGYNKNDYMSPMVQEDQGYLVTNIAPYFDNDGEGVEIDSARATRANQPFEQSGPFSTFGGGYGKITYPTADTGEFNHAENTVPREPAPGPTRPGQTNDFPITNKPVAFMTILGRGNGAGFPSGTENVLQVIDYSDSGSAGSGQVPNAFRGQTLNVFGQNIIVSEATDAAGHLRGTASALKNGDIFYATIFVPPGGTGNPPANVSAGFFDSFLCRLNKRGGNRWDIFRYDNLTVKLLNIGDPYNQNTPFPLNVFHGDENLISGGLVILRPAKLYGSPGVTQTLITAPGVPQPVPYGAGETFNQSRITISGGDSIISRFTQLGTKITVSGDLAGLAEQPEGLYVEPSGYLQYNPTPTNKLDYGSSGHVHNLSLTDSISLPRPIPKVDRTRLVDNQYSIIQLPNNHKHALPSDVVYPLPSAKLFTLCAKL